MRFISALLPLLLADLVVSITFNFPDSQNALVDDKELPVPGKNPLHYCDDPAKYILSIDYVNLSPNPPVPGQLLNVTAAGTLSKEVQPGAQLHLEVKYGLITLIKRNLDLCDQVSNVNLTCPLKGKAKIEKSVAIPEKIPPGKYSVMAHAWAEDGENITCLKSTITFT